MKTEKYSIDEKMLNKLKIKAKKIYSSYLKELNVPIKKRKLIIPGVWGSDYSFHYKTNGLKSFNSFLLVIKSTKEHIYID